MQQAIQVEASGAEPAAAATNAFVINLVSSTTPVALTRPDHAGLKRFTFFVSRRREEGRERFRLHMGYFDTQEEAERLLDIVRSIYPGAWAGTAPGRKLPGGAPTPAAATLSAEPRAVEAGRSDAKPESQASFPSPTPATVQTPALALVPDEGRRLIADVTEQRALAAVQRSHAVLGAVSLQRDDPAAAHSASNIRQTIASLDDTGPTPQPLSARGAHGSRSPAAEIPELQPAVIPTLQPAVPAAPSAPATAAAGSKAASRAESATELSDTGTLRLLETGSSAKGIAAVDGVPSANARAIGGARPAKPARSAGAASSPASASFPERAARSSGEPTSPGEKPYYAVQLMWSVQPIVLAQVPQLAIFSAYTLYGAEGNRDGRRWYGLRLGFFTDAVSAKQVAHYVRGDFSTVSVVPVSEREREQAKVAVARAAVDATPNQVAVDKDARSARALPALSGNRAAADAAKAALREPEFAFIDDAKPALVAGKSVPSAPLGRALRPGGRPTRGAPGKRAKVRSPGQVHARAKAKPKTLEETLEILGANQLQVDDGSGASLNDSGVRHLRLDTAKGKHSKLLKLFDRLSERLGS